MDESKNIQIEFKINCFCFNNCPNDMTIWCCSPLLIHAVFTLIQILWMIVIMILHSSIPILKSVYSNALHACVFLIVAYNFNNIPWYNLFGDNTLRYITHLDLYISRHYVATWRYKLLYKPDWLCSGLSIWLVNSILWVRICLEFLLLSTESIFRKQICLSKLHII